MNFVKYLEYFVGKTQRLPMLNLATNVSYELLWIITELVYLK